MNAIMKTVIFLLGPEEYGVFEFNNSLVLKLCTPELGYLKRPLYLTTITPHILLNILRFLIFISSPWPRPILLATISTRLRPKTIYISLLHNDESTSES